MVGVWGVVWGRGGRAGLHWALELMLLLVLLKVLKHLWCVGQEVLELLILLCHFWWSCPVVMGDMNGVVEVIICYTRAV